MKSAAASIGNEDYIFSASEIDCFDKIRQDYLDGKTSARNWSEINEMLNDKYDDNDGNQTDQ